MMLVDAETVWERHRAIALRNGDSRRFARNVPTDDDIIDTLLSKGV